ncbi:hypothetical protein LPJ59_002641 [Coemansia sp. RSA 2399]|nr:hypothetical protein LPJ59_002641 [Coemansia sp. RSA 2399]
MNVAEASGRREFIRLLVGWSLCTRGQLGFDETIVWHQNLKCYEIGVPSKDDPEKSVPYYSADVIIPASRLFGRHCRCFLATDTKPTGLVSEENPIVPTVVIKDSWTFYGKDAGKEDETSLTAGVEELRRQLRKQNRQ